MNTQPDPDLQTLQSQWGDLSEEAKQEIMEIITRNDDALTGPPPSPPSEEQWDILPEKAKIEIMEIINRSD
jgi:hypothetical protein